MELSAAQDVEAGDGTTSVVVLAGSLLNQAEKLLEKGIHPTIIAESFLKASKKAVEILNDIAVPFDIKDRNSLLKSAITSLNSKVSSIFIKDSIFIRFILGCFTILWTNSTHCSGCCFACN